MALSDLKHGAFGFERGRLKHEWGAGAVPRYIVLARTLRKQRLALLVTTVSMKSE